MKYILAVACASITGVSLGVALHHKSSLDNVSQPNGYTNGIQVVNSGSEEGNNHSSHPTNYAHFQSNSTNAVTSNSSHLEKKLNSLLDQQETMRNQQAELNRELNAIQFRLDTHSASFRPLQSERDSKSTTSGFLPAGLTPLLPPKQ